MKLRYICALCTIILSFQPLFSQNLENIGDSKPFQINGGLSSRLVFYNSHGIDSRRDPFAYILGGNMNLAFYGFSLPFSFTYSNQGGNFGQPFNQFGISPTYKWATLHAGYRNISYSSLTLNGHQILGAGFDINPKKLRASFMYGRLRRAVPLQPIDTVSLDTLQNDFIPVAPEPVYQRKGWGAKIGYGDDTNFIDLILFKGSDDASSLPSDSSANSPSAAENAVVGINIRQRFFEKFTFFFEGAISGYTSDRALEGNDSLQLTALQKLVKPFIGLNNSSNFYGAVKTGLNYSTSKFSVRTQYDRIAPDYQSMGAYFFNNDVESFSIVPTFYLFKSKVNVSSSLRVQRDNLQNKKLFTTRRVSPRINVSINPSYKYGIDIGYQNMTTSQKSGILEVTDSTGMRMSNPGLTLMGRLNFTDSSKTQSINLFLNRFSLNDRNEFTAPFSEYTALIANLSYVLYFIKSGIGLNASATSNRLENFSGSTNNIGFSVGASKSFFENKMNINTTSSINFSAFGNSGNLSLGINYTPNQKHNLNFQTVYTSSNQASGRFSEFNGFFEYRYSF